MLATTFANANTKSPITKAKANRFILNQHRVRSCRPAHAINSLSQLRRMANGAIQRNQR